MRDPSPTTSSDLLSQWDAVPRSPEYWPGLGNEHSDGYEIDRAGVRAASLGLVKLSASAGNEKYFARHPDNFYLSLNWRLPGAIGQLLYYAGRAFSDFLADLYAETAMAGLLIEHCAQRYDLVEEPLLGDIARSRFEERIAAMLPGDSPRSRLFTTPSEDYPKSSLSLRLSEGVDYGVGHMTAEKAKEDFSPDKRFDDDSPRYRQATDALVELARALQSRAQDLRDSPWRGGAADNAQTALRQIYGNATALAVVAGGLATATSRYAELLDWCRHNFDRGADPDRSDRREFWDFGGTPDSRTRAFLEEPNREFKTVYEDMPKRIEQNLPGLLVTDQTIAETRKRVDELWPDLDERLMNDSRTEEDLWEPRKQEQERLLKYEEAEKRFG
ncbi:WXG100 family type VII secretion target [Streptosporangium canum]|uniref:WXG100 family type VII secretion target n=1 Tax=Streptosporangium canum TaxID=324952 RepID=UPI0033AF0C07